MAKENRRKEERQRRGKAAEREVARTLAELPRNEYAVFNNVRALYGDIDHLVIHRSGAVYLLETKGHHGKVTWDGKQLLLNGHAFEKDFIAQIHRNITWLRQIIKEHTGVDTWIFSCLVFPNALIYSSKNKRVLRLKPVKWVNVVCGGFLKRLIELYVPATAKPAIWEKKETMFG